MQWLHRPFHACGWRVAGGKHGGLGLLHVLKEYYVPIRGTNSPGITSMLCGCKLEFQTVIRPVLRARAGTGGGAHS